MHTREDAAASKKTEPVPQERKSVPESPAKGGFFGSIGVGLGKVKSIWSSPKKGTNNHAPVPDSAPIRVQEAEEMEMDAEVSLEEEAVASSQLLEDQQRIRPDDQDVVGMRDTLQSKGSTEVKEKGSGASMWKAMANGARKATAIGIGAKDTPQRPLRSNIKPSAVTPMGLSVPATAVETNSARKASLSEQTAAADSPPKKRPRSSHSNIESKPADALPDTISKAPPEPLKKGAHSTSRTTISKKIGDKVTPDEKPAAHSKPESHPTKSKTKPLKETPKHVPSEPVKAPTAVDHTPAPGTTLTKNTSSTKSAKNKPKMRPSRDIAKARRERLAAQAKNTPEAPPTSMSVKELPTKGKQEETTAKSKAGHMQQDEIPETPFVPSVEPPKELQEGKRNQKGKGSKKSLEAKKVAVPTAASVTSEPNTAKRQEVVPETPALPVIAPTKTEKAKPKARAKSATTKKDLVIPETPSLEDPLPISPAPTTPSYFKHQLQPQPKAKTKPSAKAETEAKKKARQSLPAPPLPSSSKSSSKKVDRRVSLPNLAATKPAPTDNTTSLRRTSSRRTIRPPGEWWAVSNTKKEVKKEEDEDEVVVKIKWGGDVGDVVVLNKKAGEESEREVSVSAANVGSRGSVEKTVRRSSVAGDPASDSPALRSKCDKCVASFRTKADLDKHKRMRHGGNKPLGSTPIRSKEMQSKSTNSGRSTTDTADKTPAKADPFDFSDDED